MLDPFDNYDEAGGTLFRDVLSLALMGFLAVMGANFSGAAC